MKNKIKYSDMPEVDVITMAKDGDIDAFNYLIQKYNNTIYNFSFKICRNEEKAKMTLQDTLINTYKFLKSYDGKSKFTTWLYKIVSNNCLMMARSNKNKHTVSIDEDDFKIEVLDFNASGINENPSKKLLNDELKSKLDIAIKNLPEKYRLVFLLRDIEDLSIEETGKILNLTVPVVKTRLHRARIFLRNQLKEYYE
jgi:RNA polymerase sigma-70 factor, ECF subfamily